ncbi:hypothetical protein [Luteolibacter sp. Populi]|uniref:hypothetical protein n=1 Tax=Luteolibacter sp. Populi TaxID=3230487 RepID=UPI003466C4FB
MKPPTVIAIAAALAGFSLGWLVKPSGAPPEAVAGEAGQEQSAGGKSRNRSNDPERPLVRAPRNASGRGSGEMEADQKTASAERNFNKTYASAGEKTRSAQLNRWSEAMGLDEEQEKAIEALQEGLREGFKTLQGRGKTPIEVMTEAANSERIFESEVKRLLDPEQLIAYEDFKAREKANDIEARASESYSDLVRSIDLSPSQKEQARQALIESSTAAAKKRPEGLDLITKSLSVMGGSYLTALEDMTPFLDDPEAFKNPVEVQKHMIASKRGATEDRLARLTTILTPAQLSQYRAMQDARTSFMEASNPPPAPANR